MLAKQSTVLSVKVGPILDSTGAEYASAVIGDLSISKNGGTLTAMASAATLTYIANGIYTLVTTTDNMDTVGAVQIICTKATYQMPKMERDVVPPSVHDAIFANATNATGGLLTATAAITGLAGTISTYAGGAVASVTGSVGSISGVTFPANLGSMVINAGNGHVAVVVHSVQAGAYTSAAFATGWLTAAGLTSDAANEIATAVSGIQALSRLDSMIEDDGAGQFRFDTIALEMAPAGGGGGGTDWTANERTAIRTILGVPTSGTTPTDPTSGILDTIRDSVGAIGINVYPVSASTPERVNGTTITYYRNEIRSVSVVTDFTLTSLTLSFTIEDSERTDLLTIPNASITRSGQTFTVSIGTSVTSSVGNKRWALRDITGGTNSVIARGVFSVQEAASA